MNQIVQLAEGLSEFTNFLRIEAVIHLHTLYTPLDQAGTLQFLEVLINRGPAQRQFIGDIPGDADLCFGQVTQDCKPGRVSKSLEKNGRRIQPGIEKICFCVCHVDLTMAQIYVIFYNDVILR